MFPREGEGLVGSLTRLRGASLEGRFDAKMDEGVSERRNVGGLLCMLERLMRSIARLIRVAPVPECPCPVAERRDIDIGSKPNSKRPMRVWRAKRHRAFEVRECRGIIPDGEQRCADELMTLDQ
jgi:hypothetical protein